VVLLGDALEDLDAGVVLETLRRDQGGPERLIEVLAAAFVYGLPVSWTGLLPSRHVDLPTYAFQHGRYWLDEPARSVGSDGVWLAAAGHPLLVRVVESALGLSPGIRFGP
jgi:acyl transferase domain-containing protein